MGIMHDMHAVTAPNSETCDVLPMTEEDCDISIMGIILTQYSLNKELKEDR